MTTQETRELLELAAYAMTNDELNQAIDTAARHGNANYSYEECGKLMRKHLERLLEIQLTRAVAICKQMKESATCSQ